MWLLTPSTFNLHHLSQLAVFISSVYFLHNRRQWQVFTVPTLKAFWRSIVSVSSNKQELIAHVSPCTHDLLISQETMQKHFLFHPPSPFPWNFCKHNSSGICTASQFYMTLPLLQTMWTYIYSGISLEVAAVTFCDFLCERLQRAFTHANQLHWIAEQHCFLLCCFFSACWVPLAFPQSTKLWQGTRTTRSLIWVCDLFCMCIQNCTFIYTHSQSQYLFRYVPEYTFTC